MQLKTDLYIDGEWVLGDGTLPVTNPSTGNVIAEVQTAGQSHCDAAVSAAHNAFASWSNTAPRVRGEILRKAFEIMVAEADSLAKIVSMENGKVFSDARVRSHTPQNFSAGLLKRPFAHLEIIDRRLQAIRKF